MTNDKVHIPGELDMLTRVQRCIRCHARIDSNRFWPNWEPSAWAVGVPVLSGRRGMKRLTEAEAALYRPCGRQQQAEPECTCEQTDVDRFDSRGCELHSLKGAV